ncbi:hypothetical protein H072_7467 [Dactylellina haptotyla CBS 200.50]|uniref:Uncharacterized protein n=1 Tax=Dactylellina haptotyla (strain CBS 200.50) TaxID=1284197 RepID=S8BHF9_DACHA|nr:hypothetical protein H072_7467 [Dactylellina haptotyla CBS 200.50]
MTLAVVMGDSYGTGDIAQSQVFVCNSKELLGIDDKKLSKFLVSKQHSLRYVMDSTSY